MFERFDVYTNLSASRFGVGRICVITGFRVGKQSHRFLVQESPPACTGFSQQKLHAKVRVYARSTDLEEEESRHFETVVFDGFLLQSNKLEKVFGSSSLIHSEVRDCLSPSFAAVLCVR